MMREAPRPNYRQDVQQLVTHYERAIDDIIRELERSDLDHFERTQQVALLRSIGEIIRDLDTTAGRLVAEKIEKAARAGVASTLLTIGEASTMSEALKIAQFSRLNKTLVSTIVADTQTDLLAVTQNVTRRVRDAVRKVAAETLRRNVTQGVNGSQSLRQDLTTNLRQQLGKAADTGIIDAAGRRWRVAKYADVLIQTKMMEAHKEATINEALERDVLYAVISRHGATDACKAYEGRIVKLTPDAPGDFDFVGDLPRNEIFHPFCRHVLNPIRRPDRLPDELRELNDI